VHVFRAVGPICDVDDKTYVACDAVCRQPCLSNLSGGSCQPADRMNAGSCVRGVDVDVVEGLDLGSVGDNQPC